MTDSYITVSRTACEEIVINKSRFIGYVSPCSSESDALAFLQHIRDEHKTATHHCYAYIVGENSGIMRYSDDGEPGGTAGLPIIDVMRTKSIVNCCIVVVRYSVQEDLSVHIHRALRRLYRHQGLLKWKRLRFTVAVFPIRPGINFVILQNAIMYKYRTLNIAI